jgi:hypothetical protein
MRQKRAWTHNGALVTQARAGGGSISMREEGIGEESGCRL